MYYHRSVDPKKAVVWTVVAVAVAIAVFAMVDYQVMLRSPYKLPEEQIAYSNYIFWITATMFMFGVAAAVVSYILFQKSPLAETLATSIIVSTILLIVSGLEDFLYFMWAGGLPAGDVQWTWMFQHKLFGSWSTNLHILWMLFWLGLVLPAALYYFLRETGKYTVKITTTRRR